MTLKTKMIGIMTAALVLYGVADLYILRFAIYPKFADIERREALAGTTRTFRALEREIEHLDMLCHDWASWDDTYDFVQTRSPQYICANLSKSAFADNQLHLVVIVNTRRETVWGQIFDHSLAERIFLKDFPRGRIPAGHPILDFDSGAAEDGTPSVSGIVNTEYGPMMVASRPVLTSDNNGPVRGVMMVGRFLTEGFEQRLRQQTEVDFRFNNLMGDDPARDTAPLSDRYISTDAPVVDDQHQDAIRVTARFAGLGQNPGILLKMQLPRRITAEGAAALRFTVFYFIAAGFILLLLVGWLTQRIILEPVDQITRHMIHVERTGDLSLRLGLDRKDEIGTLGVQYDAMLALLETKSRELSDDIERRRVAEQALENQQEVFQAIVDSARDAIVMIDDEARISFWNQAGSDILGYEKDAVMGQDLHILVAPLRFRNEYLKGFEIFRQSGGGPVVGKTVELMARHRDGHEVPVELSLASAQQGERWHAVGILRDITQRKADERALRESEERYRRVLETVPNSITISTVAEGRYLEVNDYFCRTTGFSREEALGRTPFDLNLFAFPEDRQGIVQAIEQKGEVNDLEIRYRRRDGSDIHSIFSARRIRYAGEDCIVSVVSDITDRKKAEEERLLLATAIEQSPDLVCITDTGRSIEYVNPAFETLTGFSRKAAIGKDAALFKGELHGRLPSRVIWESLDKGKPWKGRMTNRRQDGTTFEVESAISPVTNAEGKVIKYVSVERDITETIQQERQVRQTQKLEAIGTLAGGVAHDFNNILSGILGFTEIAMLELAPDSTARVSLEKVMAAANRAGDLVRQILAFSRKSEQEFKPTLVRIVVKEALKLCRATLPSLIEIQPRIQSGQAVLGDPTQIHQVVMNLCTNAGHAMEADGGLLTVALEDAVLTEEATRRYSNVSAGTFVKLSVTDTGCGIAPENLDRIFDPFFTTKEKGKGTGLGLSVVHGIAESHGGMLTVASRPGQGTTVTVYLPAIEAEDDKSSPEVTALPTGTERILFVDDEPFQTDLALELLGRLGYRVETENDSRQALERFRQAPLDFDLVMTDMTMPNLTGEALGLAVLTIRPDIPVILCTGYSERITQRRAESLGFRGFAMKPMVVRQIAEIVRKALGGNATGRLKTED